MGSYAMTPMDFPINIRFSDSIDGANVHTEARLRTRRAFEMYEKVFTVTSGGKDGTAVMEIAAETARELGRLPLDVVFVDPEHESTYTRDHMRELKARVDINLIWVQIPVFIPKLWSDAKKSMWTMHESKLLRPLEPDSIREFPGLGELYNEGEAERPDQPFQEFLSRQLYPGKTVAVLNGYRAFESQTRRKSFNMDNGFAQGMYPDIDGVRQVSPIWDWAVGDVWRYIAMTQCSYNGIYDSWPRWDGCLS